jgi:hypothetical protein
MSSLVSQRLNEAGAATFYPASEITAALNEGLRFFTLATLALEKTSSWTPATTFTHMMTVFADWIVILRLSTASGTKVRPCRFNDLWALDATWPSSFGQVSRYVFAGADLVGVWGSAPTTLNVTYARAPVALVNAGDVPEIPGEYHIDLVSYAVYRLRQVEGGAVLASVIPLFDEYMASVKEYSAWMRARHLAAGYDATPAEFALADRSRRPAPTPEAVTT